MRRRHSVTRLSVVVAACVCSALLAGGSAAAAGTQGVVTARTVASGGTWGTAEEVPGTAQLNQGGYANISSLACGSAGNCSAVGFYSGAQRRRLAMVVNETNGTWRSAKEVPGIGALNHGPSAPLGSVSCRSAGNCSAGGSYVDSSDNTQAFVVSETNGTWGTAEEVPGTATLDQGGLAVIESVSCGAAGNCSAGGVYTDSSGNRQAFLVTETNGVWGSAEEVPGSGALNAGGVAGLSSVRCRSAGNCTAGGGYTDASGNFQPFVVSEINGTWGTAEELPGIAALDQGGFGEIEVLACGSAGNCSVGGAYADASGNDALFVDNQTNGTWGTPEQVPGSAPFSPGEDEFYAMACAPAGNCAAGGSYVDSSNNRQAFVVSETNGTWGKQLKVPGTAALNSGEFASVYAVSCASAGNCSAGGSYTDSLSDQQAFVVSEINGTWHGAIEVPGTAVLNQSGDAAILAVACTSAGHCSAGGDYYDSSGHFQVFVVNET